MVEESEYSDGREPADGATRSGKRPRNPELDAKIQQMLIELEPHRETVFNGPISNEQVEALLASAGAAGVGGAALVAREWIKQRGEIQRERLRQDGMTHRALLTGQSETPPDPETTADDG